MSAIARFGQPPASERFLPTARAPAGQGDRNSTVAFHNGDLGGRAQRYTPVARAPAGPNPGVDGARVAGGAVPLQPDPASEKAQKTTADARRELARRLSSPVVQPMPAPSSTGGLAGTRLDIVA